MESWMSGKWGRRGKPSSVLRSPSAGPAMDNPDELEVGATGQPVSRSSFYTGPARPAMESQMSGKWWRRGNPSPVLRSRQAGYQGTLDVWEVGMSQPAIRSSFTFRGNACTCVGLHMRVCARVFLCLCPFVCVCCCCCCCCCRCTPSSVPFLLPATPFPWLWAGL